MDPLTIISGVAGIATAGSALANALYSVISGIRNAPREMVDIADSIRELSTILRELRHTARRGRRLFSDRLFRELHSAVRRIRQIHDDVFRLLDGGDGGVARVVWAFRKSKATKLLTTIASHKCSAQLIATTMVLALDTRDHAAYVAFVVRIVGDKLIRVAGEGTRTRPRGRTTKTNALLSAEKQRTWSRPRSGLSRRW